MKKLDLGQTISIAANVGVIAGIVFLAVELQQNNALLAADFRATSLTNRQSMAERFLDPQLAEVFARVSAGDELSVAEQLQVNTLYSMMLELWEWTYEESEIGLGQLPEVEAVRDVFRSPVGIDRYWQEEKDVYPADFRRWIDEVVLAE